MKVGDLVRVSDMPGLALVMDQPRLSADCREEWDQYHVVEISFWDGPYLACIDDCEIVNESR